MKIEVGTEVPVVERIPDAVDLFTFSASAWLLHRIHYDSAFATENDGHPGLVVHGPLQGTYMIQSVQWWLGPTAHLRSISYRHSQPAYVGDRLRCGGTVTGVDMTSNSFAVDLWVQKGSAEGGARSKHATDAVPLVTTSGNAVFGLPVS